MLNRDQSNIVKNEKKKKFSKCDKKIFEKSKRAISKRWNDQYG